MKKLMITGASGFLGWQVLGNAPATWRAVGTWHEHPAGLPPKSVAIQLDMTDRDAVWKALKTVKPDAVLHLAAASSPAFCEAKKDESKLINVDATTWLAEFCAERGCKFLFTSSEQVYDGAAAPFSEVGMPTPKNEYGKQKLAAELAIQAISPSAIIARMSVMYGQAGSGNKNFLGQWLEAWRRGDSVTAFYDEIRSFLSGTSAAEGLFLLLEKGVEGIFNLGGTDTMSRYDFAQLAATAHHLPQAKIIRKSQLELESPAFRPANLTLDLRKIEALGFVPKMTWQ